MTFFPMLAILACGGKPTDTGGNGGNGGNGADADTDADSDADTDADSDVDTDTDSDTDPCTDVWYADVDEDGYGDDDSKITACEQPAGYVAVGGDCNDRDADVHEYTTQYTDADRDGYGDPNTGVLTCSPAANQVSNADDCDDTDPTVSDEGLWYDDIDGDGHGNASTATVGCEPGSGQVALGDDCNDLNSNISPSETEVCNEIDDDCDLLVDDEDANLDTRTGTEFALDDDADGSFGTEFTVWACDMPRGAAPLASADDCDDTDATISPDATEICNDGVDQDCDGGAGTCGISSGGVATYDAKYKGSGSSQYFGTSVAVGDMDGDGQNDLAVGEMSYDAGSYSPGAIHAFDTWTGTSVAASTDRQTFVPGTSSTYSSAVFGVRMAMGDLNRDGLMDVLGGGYSYSSSKGLVVSYAPGAAWSSVAYDSNTGASSSDYCGYAVAVGDINGDGNADSAYGCPGETGGSVYLYSGTGLLAEISRTDVSSYHSFASSIGFADVNGDGVDDMLVGGLSTDYLWLYEGPVTASATYSAIDDETRSITYSGGTTDSVGDVDDDGYNDMVIGRGEDGYAYLLRGGTGTVLASATSISSYASAATGGDFDNDGVWDLALGDYEYSGQRGRVAIDFGPVGSSFSVDAAITGSSSECLGYSVASGDMDGDGIDDLAIGGYGDDEAGTDAGAAWVFLGGGM